MEEEAREVSEKKEHASWEDLVETEGEERGEMEVDADPLILMKIMVGGIRNISAVIDTGATRSCVSTDFYIRLKEEGELLGELPMINFQLAVAVGKKKLKVVKQILTNIS